MTNPETRKSKETAMPSIHQLNGLGTGNELVMDEVDGNGWTDVRHLDNERDYQTNSDGSAQTTETIDEEDEDTDTCSSFSLQECINEFKARRIRRTSTQSHDVVLEKKEPVQKPPLDCAEMDLINQNRTNKEHERKYKPCKNGFCYCFTSDSGDGVVVTGIGAHLRHQRRSGRKSENVRIPKTIPQQDINRKMGKPRRQSVPPSIKIANTETIKSSITNTTTSSDQIKAISRLGTAPKDAPLIHIIQELRNNCVISEVRVNKHKIHVHRSQSLSSKPPKIPQFCDKKKAGGIGTSSVVPSKNITPTAPPLERISEHETQSDPFVYTTCLDTSAKSSVSRGRRHKAAGLLLQKRMSQAPVQFKARNFTEPPPKPPRRSSVNSGENRNSISTLTSTTPSVREAERVVDEYLMSQGIAVDKKTLPGKEQANMKIHKQKMEKAKVNVNQWDGEKRREIGKIKHHEQEKKSGGNGSTLRRIKDSKPLIEDKTQCRNFPRKIPRAYPSLSDIERLVDKEQKVDQPSGYGKNTRSVTDKFVKEHSIGWRVDESKIHQMLNCDSSPNARQFRSQAVQAEPQTIGWQIPPKLALDAVDGGLGQNLDANMSIKNTPIKENSPPLPNSSCAPNGSGLQKSIFRKQMENLMPSPWSNKTVRQTGQRYQTGKTNKVANVNKMKSNLKKSSQNFLNNSKKRILRLVSPKKENRDCKEQLAIRKTPYRSIGVQTSKEELGSLESSSTPQSPPGSYFSAMQTSQQSTTPSNSQHAGRTQEAGEAKREQVNFNFNRKVNSPPKKSLGLTQRKLNFPLWLNEGGATNEDDFDEGAMTKTYRSFQSDLDQDATLSKMGFILSNIRAKLEASDNHAVRTFREIGQREQQIAANLDCTDGLHRGHHQIRNNSQRRIQANRHFIIDERDEPIYSEIEEDSIHILSGPNVDNKTGNGDDPIPEEKDPSALYAKVAKVPKNVSGRAETNEAQVFQQHEIRKQQQQQLQQHQHHHKNRHDSHHQSVQAQDEQYQINQYDSIFQEEQQKDRLQHVWQSEQIEKLKYEQKNPNQLQSQYSDYQESIDERYNAIHKEGRHQQNNLISETYPQKHLFEKDYSLPQTYEKNLIQQQQYVRNKQEQLHQEERKDYSLDHQHELKLRYQRVHKEFEQQQTSAQKQDVQEQQQHVFQNKQSLLNPPQDSSSPSSNLARCLQDLIRSKIKLKPITIKLPQKHISANVAAHTFHSPPTSLPPSPLPNPALSQTHSLNNIRVQEHHSPPKYNRNLSKSDLSLHRSEIFLENLCRSEFMIDGACLVQTEKELNLNVNSVSYTSVNSPSESKNTLSQQNDVIDGIVDTENVNDADADDDNDVSYELPDDANTDLSQSIMTGSQLDLNQSTPKKLQRIPQSFTTKENLIEQDQDRHYHHELQQQHHELIVFIGDDRPNLYSHSRPYASDNSPRSCSFPNTPRKLPNYNLNDNNQLNDCTTSLIEAATSYTDSQSHPVCCNSTAARYQRFKKALRNSFRKSKKFVKAETRRLSSSFNFPSAPSVSAAAKTATKATAFFNKTIIPSTNRRSRTPSGEFLTDSSFNLDSLFALEDENLPLQQQLAKAVSICRQLPDLEISPEMVEAERLLLYSTLRLQLIKFPPTDSHWLRENRKTHLYVDAMRIPIRTSASRDLFFNYFYICTFYCGGAIKSTQSVECRNHEAVFSDCGVEFIVGDSEAEVKCEVFMLRLRKVSTISLERKRRLILNRSTSSMTSSTEDIVSRFRLHGSFTVRPIDFTPYEYDDVKSKSSSPNICLSSSVNCKLSIIPRTKSTNLTNEVSLTGRAILRFPKLTHKGFLNVQESESDQHYWNRRWCTLDGIFVYVWQDVSQDEDENHMDNEITTQPLLNFDLRLRSKELHGRQPLESVARELCARPRSFALDCCLVTPREVSERIAVNNRSAGTTRTVFFSADSQSDLNDWLMKLNEVFDFIYKWMGGI